MKKMNWLIPLSSKNQDDIIVTCKYCGETIILIPDQGTKRQRYIPVNLDGSLHFCYREVRNDS